MTRAPALCLFALLWLAGAGHAAMAASHGLSVFGDLKYGPRADHFDYVRADAPKGGSLRLRSIGSFDSLNLFILKGVKADGFGGVHDSLMARAMDEPDALYGLIARRVELDPARRWIAFELNPAARFHDGSRITAKDVVFTFRTLIAKGHPQYRLIYRGVAGAEVEGPRRVRFDFKPGATRDLPVRVALMPVLSKTYYASHDFAKTTLKPPLGSGPYRITDVADGRSITYGRVADYWARDLLVNKGRWNFDTVRIDYYRDRSTALLAFFAGAYDFREEFTSKSWATEYDDKNPVRDGRIVRDVLDDATPSGVQAFFFNLRRPKFADARVREALDLAFDYEWTNKNIFHGLYDRTNSMFENSELAHAGPPSKAELALLEPFRGQVPDQVFGPEFVPPRTDASGISRRNLRQARKLLIAAGWRIENGELADQAGRPFAIEFLLFEPTFNRVIGPYIKNLARLGIQASIRMVDPSTFERRRREFDFDVITARFAMPVTPGVELKNYFGSESADLAGSLNYAGIADPVVDKLIDAVMAAPDRPALIAATRALDRVLMWHRYVVTQWYKGSHTIAYWDKYGRPPVKPLYARGVIDTWWFDAAKAAKLDASGGQD